MTGCVLDTMSGCSMKQANQSRVHVATESGSSVRKSQDGSITSGTSKALHVLINFCSPKIHFFFPVVNDEGMCKKYDLYTRGEVKWETKGGNG